MTEQIIKQSFDEIAAGTPFVKVLDTVKQGIEQPDFTDGIKSSLARAAITHGNISEAALHDLVVNQSLEPQDKIPRVSPEADRLLVLAFVKQRRNKRR